MYVNEMQRTINGFGQAPGGKPSNIVPYGQWQPYRPGAIARGPGFGDVPNDFEASVDLQYIPVRQGWYYGQSVNGGTYPDANLPLRNGLGRHMGDATSEEALKQLAKSEKLQTILQVVSTLSIATVATLAVIKAIRSRRGGGDARLFGDDDE
jgi:hypothetical protein